MADADELRGYLERLVFLLGGSDGQALFGPSPPRATFPPADVDRTPTGGAGRQTVKDET